jgi:membrane protease YdiL (CAAX protease family)
MKLASSSKLADPYNIIAAMLYFAALIGLAFVSGSVWPALLLGFGVMLLSTIISLVTKTQVPQIFAVTWPQLQLWLVLIWYGLVTLLAAISLANGVELVNGFTNWFFLVLAPLGILALTRGPGKSLRDILLTIGLTRAGLKNALRLALLIIPLSIPLLYVIGEQQRASIQMFFQNPLNALSSFLISFVFAVFTASFVEEFFFRGILQSRFAAYLGSEWRGLLIASFLFGLIHLPMYYYSPFEPTHGNLIWSISSIVTEQMVAGILLGIVWMRTHTLIAPVLLHGFINAMAMMAVLKIGVG